MFSKYRELGLSLIPLKRGQKFPTMDEWERFSGQLPTEDETDLWDRLWTSGHRSVGLVCGPASNICGLDLDTDDPELLAMAPLSPVVKRGAKGETRFFRPCPDLRSQSPNGLDLLWTGRQTVLPPSPHPDTGKDYVWLSPDTLENYDVKDLPVIDISFLPRYVALFEKRYPKLCKKNPDGHSVGRNNWLKDVVWAKRINGEPEEDIVEAVYQMDLHKNNPRLFTDAKEGFKSNGETDARMNAWKFVARVTKTFIDRKAGPAPQMRLPEILIGQTSRDKKFVPTPYPEPQGMLGKLYRASIAMNRREAKNSAIGGAIAIGSVIIANRFKLKGTWPNIYILNVGDTGSGKGAVQDLAKNLLSLESGAENLFGCGNYSSSVAVAKNLTSQRQRLDVIDEASSLFNKISHGGVFQSDIDDTLCELYSCSKSMYVGSETKGQDAVRVWHPCVSMLMSTTLKGLKTSISNSLATKGFFPRCLLFIQYEYPTQKRPDLDPQEIVDLGAMIRDIRSGLKNKRMDLINNDVPDPTEIPCDQDADDLIEATIYKWNEELEDVNRPEVERTFLSRAGEQMIKLALIHGALRLRKVEVLDVIWAIETMNAMRANASSVFPELSAENRGHQSLERVLTLIRAKGVISHRELLNKTRFLAKRERNDILEGLAEEGIIQRTNVEGGAVWSIL